MITPGPFDSARYSDFLKLKKIVDFLYANGASSSSIAGLISSGTNITITGAGTQGNPYVISASGGGSSYTFSSPLSESGGTISIQNAAADGTTKGAATFTANDFSSSSGVISIDYTNGQAASSSTKGFLTSTDWNIFNNKQAAITTGTTAQYLRGDLSLATFPTTLSSFTNDAGYLTSSALSGYLQHNVGRASGTILIGDTASGGNLTLSSTSNATKGNINFDTFWRIDGSGHLLAQTDNTYDIGASGATRPRHLYVGSTGTFGGTITAASGINIGLDQAIKRGGSSSHQIQFMGSGLQFNTIAPNFTISGNMGISNSYFPAAAKVHIINTTEQLRIGFDASNYFSTTVSSAGAVTFDAVGTSARFTFNDPVTINSVETKMGSGSGFRISANADRYFSLGENEARTSTSIGVSFGNQVNAREFAQFSRNFAGINTLIRYNCYFGGDQLATARIHIAAGTATASTAPLKFTSGTNLTTPETGAIEYDGTNFYQTNSTTVRGVLEKTRVATNSAASLTLDATYSTWVHTGTGATWTLPAASSSTHIKFYISNKGSGTLTLASASGNEIWQGTPLATFDLNAGTVENYMLVSDGTHWIIF